MKRRGFLRALLGGAAAAAIDPEQLRESIRALDAVMWSQMGTHFIHLGCCGWQSGHPSKHLSQCAGS
jgi:hypothetical protein